MAFDKNQLLIHQMQVKGQRLESGLRRLVEAIERGGDVYGEYCYALGCLGHDDVKKKLMATPKLKDVIEELKSKHFIREESADKAIAEWLAKGGDKLEGKVIIISDGSGINSATSINMSIEGTNSDIDLGDDAGVDSSINDDGSREIIICGDEVSKNSSISVDSESDYRPSQIMCY